MRISRHGIVLVLLMILAGFVFTLGITWGLPSRQDDRYLLGEDYHGLYLERFTSQVPEVDAARGADVVAPVGNPNEIVHLNDTDEKRAQILCRYRLYSYQPDEMITFRALSLMKPGSLQFDPRLYQYGGLWIYPVGGMIEAGHLLGLVGIADRSTYIDNPELFGKFYVVARAYSAAWGVVGVWAVFAIMRRLSAGGTLIPAFAATSFILMPVVINAAHEAKPHLAGTVLVLLAVLAADYWIQTGKMCWASITGVLSGAAAGMVLWGVVSIFIIPAMVYSRRVERRVRLLATAYSLLAMAGIYAVTNPYVCIHLIHDPSVLRSNLGNTAGMYGVSWSIPGLWNAISLMYAGAVLLPLAGAIGLIFILIKRMGGAFLLLAVVSLAAIVQFASTAAGKPGEYARFALLPDAALAIIAFAPYCRIKNLPGALKAISFMGIILGPALFRDYGYSQSFLFDTDAWDMSSRRATAFDLDKALARYKKDYAQLRTQGKHISDRPVLGVYADPAPYCLPPVDLTEWDIIRLPRGFDPKSGPPIADVIVRPNEDSPWELNGTPISWAHKEFNVTKISVEERTN